MFGTLRWFEQSCRQDDRDIGMQDFHFGNDFDSGHAWKEMVKDHHVNPILSEEFQSGTAVACADYSVADTFQHERTNCQKVRLIINAQDDFTTRMFG